MVCALRGVTGKASGCVARRVSKRAFSYGFRWLFVMAMCIVNIAYARVDTSIRVQLAWQHQFEFAGFYAAVEQGFYRSEGLDVELVAASSETDVLTEVISGRAHFGLMNSELVLHRMQGQAVLMLANFFKNSPLVLVTKPNIRSADQLNGKHVMVNHGELDSAPFLAMFKASNLSQSDIITVPHSFSAQPFIDDEVDAFTAFLSNELYDLDKQQVPYNLLFPANYGVSSYDSNLFTSSRLAQLEPELVDRFVRATLRGWRYAFEHQLEVATLIQRDYGSTKSLDALLYEAEVLERLSLLHVYPLGSIDPLRIQMIAELYKLTQKVPEAEGSLEGFVYQPPQKLMLSQQEQAFLTTQPNVRISSQQQGPLQLSEQGESTGYVSDYLRLLADIAGLSLSFVEQNNPRKAIQSTPPLIDVIPTVSTLQQESLADSYLQLRTGLLVRKELSNVSDLQQLAGKRLAVVSGSSYQQLLGKYFPSIQQVACIDIIDCLNLASIDKADAVIDALPVLQYNHRKYMTSGLRIVGAVRHPQLRTLFYQLSVRSDWPELASILTKAQQQVTAEQLQQLRQRWFGALVPVSGRLQLSDWEHSYLLQKGSVRYCIDPNWLPFEGVDQDGKHIGVTADYLDLIKSVTRAEFSLTSTRDWTDSLASVYDRRCDLILAASKTPERQRHLLFTEPYYQMPLIVATQQDKPFIDSMHSVLPARFAVVRGYAWADMLEEKYPNIDIMLVDDIADGLKKVANGEVYGYIDGMIAVAQGIRQQGLVNLKVAGKTDINIGLSIGIRNDEPELLSILNKVVQAITQEEHQQIQSRSVSLNVQQAINYELLWKFVIAALILAAFMLYRHYLLAKQARALKVAHTSLRAAHQEIASQNRTLEKLSQTDRLTGVHNRMRLEQDLQQQIDHSLRYGRPMSIMLIDIDHFKSVNDRYGHQEGDVVLQKVAATLKKNVRTSDSVGRWGGEEFLIICPETDAEAAMLLADKLRQLVELQRYADNQIITVSIGSACWTDNEPISGLMKRADVALYKAKDTGRNRVILAC